MINAKNKFCVALLFFAGCTTTTPITQVSPLSWGPAEKQLRLGVSVADDNVDAKRSPEILISLENISKEDVVINLGFMLANGKRQYPIGLHLLLTDSGGITHEFHYFPPEAGIAGRVDQFIVPLPAGSIYQLRCPLNRFMQKDAPFGLIGPGQYTLAASFEGRSVTQHETNMDMVGLSLTQYWTGTINSGKISISVP